MLYVCHMINGALTLSRDHSITYRTKNVCICYYATARAGRVCRVNLSIGNNYIVRVRDVRLKKTFFKTLVFF